MRIAMFREMLVASDMVVRTIALHSASHDAIVARDAEVFASPQAFFALRFCLKKPCCLVVIFMILLVQVH